MEVSHLRFAKLGGLARRLVCLASNQGIRWLSRMSKSGQGEEGESRLEGVEVIEDEEEGLPDAATAKKLIKEFESVTNTDEIMAQYQLQEHGWDLSRALNSFFTDKIDQAEADMTARTNEKPDLPRKTVAEALQEGLLSTKAPESLVFVTWNIDGLDQTNLKKRTKGVCKILEQEAADIVFLQEVIPETFSYIESKMPNYVCLAAKQHNYFVATLLRKGRVYLDHHTVKDFHTSSMGRHVLAAQAHCGSVKLDLFNTHLESTKEHAEERGSQLKQCLAQVGSRPTDKVSILAGDLNLRDAELVASGGLPNRTVDVWEKCGARKEVQYTWDMMRNTNLQANFGKFRPRCRFDRIYLRDSLPTTVSASHFGLIGLQKITDTQAFPSDHWGLRCVLNLVQASSGGENPTQGRKRKAEQDFD